MSKRLSVSRAAQSDIEDIYDYTLTTWGRAQADDYVTQLEHTLTAAAAGDKAVLSFAEWQPNAGYYVCGQAHCVCAARDGTAVGGACAASKQ